MKHIYEYSKFSIPQRKPSLFRKKRNFSGSNTIMVSTDLADAKVLVAVDFVEFLSGLGVKGDIKQTALEDEDYEIKTDKRIELDELISLLPEKPSGEDAMSTAPVEIWYKGEEDYKRAFMWGWGKGVYKIKEEDVIN